MNLTKDLVAASATPLVLGILARDDNYGYAILKQISEVSAGQLNWTDGMLYPLLHRLERLGFVESTWGRSESGRRRKYYRITTQGREALRTHRQQWDAVDQALRSIWREMSSIKPLPEGST